MPLALGDFPYEAQVAFFIHDLLPENYSAMGDYLGKGLEPIEMLFRMYEVEEQKYTFLLVCFINNAYREFYAEEAKRKRDAAERKSQSGGKNYAHNVQG